MFCKCVDGCCFIIGSGLRAVTSADGVPQEGQTGLL